MPTSGALRTIVGYLTWLGATPMSQKNLISSISGRLRIILFTVVLLVLSQPIIVYFATGQIINRQNEVSENLIRTEYQRTRLTEEIGRIAAEGQRLRFIEDPAALERTASSLIEDTEAVTAEFSGAVGNFNYVSISKEIEEKLRLYTASIGIVAKERATQIATEQNLDALLFDARESMAEMSDLLKSEIVQRKIALDQSIVSLESNYTMTNVTAVRQAYNELITLNSIADAIDSERFLLSSVDRNLDIKQPENMRARAQLQSQGLTVKIAKLPRQQTQTELAARAIAIADIMFGDQGVFEQVTNLKDVQNRVLNNLETQETLTNQLVTLTQLLTSDARAHLIANSAASGELVQSTRVTTAVITTIAGILIIGVIIFVIERQFNRRISALIDRMLAIAAGRSDPGLPLKGRDELSAMSAALEVFKENAANLREANTSLEQSNEEIRQLGGRLRTILDTATSGIIAFDNDGQIILANRPARHFMGGISENTPFFRPPTVKFLNPEDLAPLEDSSDPINRVLAGQILNQETALMQRAGVGDGRYVRLTSGRVDDDSSIVRTVLAIDDVSVAEQNRQQIERASRLDALGQLTGGIAHDFNNLLATIQYAVQLSADSDDPDKQAAYTKIALESVERGSQLSIRLLTFAKRQPGIARSISIEKILDDFKGLVKPTIEAAVSVEFRIDDPDMSVYCDSAQLENALLNLVLNARDAILISGTGDAITVAVRAVSELNSPIVERQESTDRGSTNTLEAELRAQDDGDLDHTYRYVEFSVTDNGPGMTDDVKRRALDPFFSTKSTNSSTGLGLSMVYGFVEQSGGELRIYSELGRGTTMRMLLPRGNSENEREEPVLREAPIRGEGQTILLAEDEPHLRTAMDDVVSALGYKVVSANSGQSALKLVEDGLRFDLLLTDIVMPGGISGFELAAEVRRRHSSVAVVYMSGYAAYTDREMGMVIAPLLQKPCSQRALSEHIRDELARFAAVSPG